LNELGDTILYVAAGIGKNRMVEELCKMTSIEEMLKPNSEGLLPFHMAAQSANHRIMKHLSSKHLLDNMHLMDIKKLFFIAINNMFSKPSTCSCFTKFNQFIIE